MYVKSLGVPLVFDQLSNDQRSCCYERCHFERGRERETNSTEKSSSLQLSSARQTARNARERESISDATHRVLNTMRCLESSERERETRSSIDMLSVDEMSLITCVCKRLGALVSRRCVRFSRRARGKCRPRRLNRFDESFIAQSDCRDE